MRKMKSNKTTKLKQSIMGMLLSAAIVCCAATAFAEDAVRIFLELSSTTATVWPGGSGKEYIRGRAVCLDANNELATTFAENSITSAQLVFASKKFGSNARFSTISATKEYDWSSLSQTVQL